MNFTPAEQFEKLYKVCEILGNGQYALVKRCVHRVTHEEYAVKFIKKRRVGTHRRGAKRQDIEREVEILREVGGHENIISLHQVYESSTDVILVLEYVSGGELFHHVCSKERLCEEEASAFIKQILIGIQHLHTHHVAHLDLKPENIMLQSQNSTRIKIIDFGLSRKIRPNDTVREMIGTPEFVAPEIVEYENLSCATDMWAIGVITYILLSGMSPFMGETRDNTFTNISSVQYDFDDEIFANTSELAKDFIREVFKRDPKKRATCDECLRHPWIEPKVIEHANLRRECSINVNQIKTFHVRKRWKQVYRAVIICNRLTKKAKLRSLQMFRASGGDQNYQKNDKHVIKDQNFNTKYDTNQFVMSSLMCASEEGNITGLEELLAVARVDLNMANELGETAMHVAAGTGQLEVVQFLQYRGANINVTDKHGDTPLYWAARHGHVNVVDYLVKESVPVNYVNKCKETALHVAVRYGHVDVVENLINAGADVNRQDEHGENSLHIASWHGFPNVLEILTQANPDMNLFNKDEESALHCAAVRGHVECVQTLLASGANVDVYDKNGQTPLHLAIRRHHVDICLLLLHYNCKFDAEDKSGDTPLHLACREGLLTVVQTLCHLGCQVDMLNKASLSPLHIAAKDGHLELVRVLCLSGANINIKNKDGITPQISALASGFSPVGELLERLKNDQQRETYIEQLCPSAHLLKRIKLKIFGHSAVGKTKLLESLRTSLLGSFFRRRSDGSAKDDVIENGRQLQRTASKIESPAHTQYTKGIDVQQVNVSGCGEFSTWDFSGYPTYQQLFDHFVGNTDCIHMILFRVTDPTEIQYQQVVYWLNFLKSRIMPTEPIGHAGVSSKPAYVILVGTHADTVEPPLAKNPEGEWTSSEAEAMLKTIKHRFNQDFVIHNQLIMLDALHSNCPGVKLLKTYLAQTRSDIIQGLPKSTGFLEATLNYVSTLRKNMSPFPVVPWPKMVNLVRKEVNPLAGEVHCRQMIQQLQLMGEVIYVKGEVQEFDYVVLNPQWFCHDIVGTLFSAEFLHTCHPTGCYTTDDFHGLFPDVPDIVDLLQLLDAVGVCTQYESDSDLEYEFASLNNMEPPKKLWDREMSNTSPMVYGGVKLMPPRGMEHMLTSIFPRIQVHLRRSMQEFQDPVDADLNQWRFCSRVCSGQQMEGMMSLTPKDQAVEIRVRGPMDQNSSCFYFLEDLANIVEQTVSEVAPGLPLERHFLSPKDLAERSYTVKVYPPDLIMDMQVKEKVTVKCAGDEDAAEEKFLDLVCFSSKDVALALTLGVDLSITQIPLYARRELAALLDPQDSMGRDWSILAVKLGLTETLPEVDNSGPMLSKTDQILAEWALRNPHSATVGALISYLKELERSDVNDILYKTIPLYTFSPLADDHATASNNEKNLMNSTSGNQCNDSGVVSNNSNATSATSQRTSSTLSR